MPMSKEQLQIIRQTFPPYSISLLSPIFAYYRFTGAEKEVIELVQHAAIVLRSDPNPDIMAQLIGPERFGSTLKKCEEAQAAVLERGYIVQGVCMEDVSPPLDDLL